MYNQARNTLNMEIRAASAWKGLKAITNYKTPSPSTEANQQLADDLNEFYCRFEPPPTHSDHLLTQPLTPPTTPLSPTPALQISEDDVRQVFRKNKRRKAPGPDGLTPACLNPVLTSWPPSSHRSSTDHWSCVKSPHASNAPSSSPSQRNPKLQACGSNVCPHEVIWKTGSGLSEGHHWTPFSLLTEQTGPWMMQSTWDCISSCSIWTNQGLMWGSCLWTSVRP